MTAHAFLLAGALFAAAITIVLGGAFFVEAWRRRPAEREYLLFGLVALALAGYAGAAAGTYWSLGTGEHDHLPGLADLALASAAVAGGVLLDFVMRYRRKPNRSLTSAGYAFAAVAILVALLGFWRAPEGPTTFSVVVAGVELPSFVVHLTWLGKVLVTGIIGMLSISCGHLVVDRWRWPARGGGPMAVGSALLLAAAAHDAASLGAGLFASVSLTPFGFIAFVYGVAVTLVSRYGRLSRTLSQRESELRARSDELARSLAELQQAQEELLHSEQLAVVGEFAAVITHEVRNPMAIVNNAVTSLRRTETVTDDTRSLLGIIESEMLRLERLVTHLLNYARPVVPQREAVELDELLMASMHGALGNSPDVESSVECTGEWPTIYVDPLMMAQAFDNILVNALMAMDQRGELRVRVARRTVQGVKSVIIGFEDSGEGMTEHQLEQALSPFYTTWPAGTGLGLAICDRIVDAHGGMVILSSERGVGTAVSIIVPEKPDESLRVSRRSSYPAPSELH